MRNVRLGTLMLLIVCVLAMGSQAAAAETTVLKFACWDYEVSGYDPQLIKAFEAANPDILE